MSQRPARQASPRLEPTTGYLVVRIAEAIDRKFVEHLAPLGIRPRHLHVLRQLHAHGSMSQQALAEMIRVDPGNLIATLDELQADGLIRRDVDRRRRVLQVTARGVRMLRQGVTASERADDEVLGNLSQAERASLRSAALHVYEHLRRSP